MTCHEDHVYVLSPNDVVRIREYLSMLNAAIDRIFDRCETSIPSHVDADEIMGDIEFFEKCHYRTKEIHFDIQPR